MKKLQGILLFTMFVPCYVSGETTMSPTANSADSGSDEYNGPGRTAQVNWDVTVVSDVSSGIEKYKTVSGSVSGKEKTVSVPEMAAAESGSSSGLNDSASKVKIKSVLFSGNTVIDSGSLSEIASSFIERPIDMSDLEELRVRLTKAYTDQGYLNSGALLPNQEVKNGVVTYQLVEGNLDGVNVSGSGRLNEDYIIDRLLKGANKPFNSNKLQRNFQLLLDDPLIERMDGKLSTIPGESASQLNLDVTRARPYDFSLGLSNHTSPSLGEQQLEFDAQFRNPSGYGDVVRLTASQSDSRSSLSAMYSIPITSSDTRLRFQISTTDSGVIEEPLDAIDIESNTEGMDLSVEHPLQRAVEKNISIGAGLSVRENTNLLAGQPFSFSIGEDDGYSRVGVIRAWQNYIKRSEVGVFAARSTVKVGLDAFDSTKHNGTRPDGQFISFQAQLRYVHQFLSDRAQLLLRVDGQLSDRALLSLERFSLGGANSVRGYRENELVRDQAILASVEYRYQLLSSGKWGTWTVAPFGDYGYGRNRSGFSDAESLLSVGTGLLWSRKKNLSAALYYGLALEDAPNSKGDSLQDNGVHFRFQSNF